MALEPSLDQFSNEYLLERAHAGVSLNGVPPEGIRAELARRGVEASSLETVPSLAEMELPDTSLRRGLRAGWFWLVLLLSSAFLVQVVVHSPIGNVVAVLLALIAVGYWLANLGTPDPPKEKQQDDKLRAALSPVTLAAADGDIDRLADLLRSGADPNTRESHDLTPLMYAARNGRVEAVRLLLEAGADRNARSSSGATPADFAQRYGHTELTELLSTSEA